MARTIAIDGIRLDEVHMPMKAFGDGSVSYLCYPMSQIHSSRDERGIRLVIPAYLAVELYRIGVLPQDSSTPVEISISGRSVGRYVVIDVRYPMGNDGPFGQVSFTLTRVLQGTARKASVRPRSHLAATRTSAYVTDITHYLDESGELAQMPDPARKLASFLTLLIEAATSDPSEGEHDSGIRCKAKACRGTIRTLLQAGRDEISWNCQTCGHNGVIRNWINTRWNQLKWLEKLE